MARKEDEQANADGAEGKKSAQEVRDAHYFEEGVDPQGNAPKNVTFDVEGNAHDGFEGDDE